MQYFKTFETFIQLKVSKRKEKNTMNLKKQYLKYSLIDLSIL
jgi:hypothetical protein